VDVSCCHVNPDCSSFACPETASANNRVELCDTSPCTHDECCDDEDICDECGTCDVDPANNCFKDCDGVWGGPNNIPGDVSGDCNLNVLDIIQIVGMIMTNEAPAFGRDFDITGDGNRNILDVVKLVAIILDN